MPLSRVRRAPDPERLAVVLGGPAARGSALSRGMAEGRSGGPGWQPEGHSGATGWVPADPRTGPLRARVGAGVRVGAVVEAAPRERADEAAALTADLRTARRPGLVTLPESLRNGRLVASGTAVVSLLALVVAVGCAFVLRVLWAERSAAPEPTAPSGRVQVASGGATGGFDAAGGAAGGPGATPRGGSAVGARVVVHVVGEVSRPGLVRLPPGSRVAEAIEAAGGATKRADLTQLNLARVVADGEQVHVPRPGEVVAGGSGAGGAAGSAGTAGSGGGVSGSDGGRVNLNTADVAALDSLPGVGPVLAQRIVDWRTQNGRFTSVEELGEVSGIGDKMLTQLRSKVTV